MKKFFIAMAALLLSGVAAADIVVIINAGNAASMSETDVANIFLGKVRSFPNGQKAVPIMLDYDAPGVENFSRHYLGKSVNQLRAYWSNMTFTGAGIPPQNIKDSKDVVELVAKNPSLIGMVDGGSVSGAVKVVKLP